MKAVRFRGNLLERTPKTMLNLNGASVHWLESKLKNTGRNPHTYVGPTTTLWSSTTTICYGCENGTHLQRGDFVREVDKIGR